MMKLGIKVGPNDWQEKLTQAEYDAVEVAYDIRKEADYNPVFSYLKKNHVCFGLHFWKAVDQNCFPNYTTDNLSRTERSLATLKRVIETGAKWGACYVLFHTCGYDLWKISDGNKLVIETQKTSNTIAWNRLLEHTGDLNEYAESRGVKLVIEGVCRNEATIWAQDIEVEDLWLDVRGPNLADFRKLGTCGIGLCADMAHLSTWFGPANREQIYKELNKRLNSLRNYLKVIHAASIKLPYITDTGNGFTSAEVARGVFPNGEEVISLLKSLRDTSAIVVPEPIYKDHLWHNAYLRNSHLFRW